MGTEAGPGETAVGLQGIRAQAGVALMPVCNIPDRATIAYEAVARPAQSASPLSVVRGALELAHYTAPAILLIPFDAFARGGAATARALTGEYGVSPAEVAWVVQARGARECSLEAETSVTKLREAGFRIAVEPDGWATTCHDWISRIRPDFLVIDADVVAQLPKSDVARAELAGLISFSARLDVRLIARGVDSPAIARALTSVGLQHGSGEHLGRPLVLDPAIAAPDDELVGPSWFRQHEPRRLDAVAGQAQLPTQVVTLPDATPADVSADVFAQTLGEAARLLQAEHDPARIMRVVADLLPRVIPMSALAILEADWDNDTLIPRVLAGDEVVSLRDAPFAMSHGITGWAFARGVPYNCANTMTHPAAGTVPGTEDSNDDESLLVIPLISGDHRIGVLDVWRRGVAQFSVRDLEQCALFAHIAAAAWHNANLYREVENRARTDALTGLHNTRWLDEVMPQEAARALRNGTEIGALLLDIDHFKLINDTGGHAAGDHALRNVARVLRSVVRSGDDLVRYGGEEFLILLHDSGLDGAVRVAEEVRQALHEMQPAVPDVRITASVGVAVFPLHGASLDEVVRVADTMMYRAKTSGRDRVIAAPAVEIAQAS